MNYYRLMVDLQADSDDTVKLLAGLLAETIGATARAVCDCKTPGAVSVGGMNITPCREFRYNGEHAGGVEMTGGAT